MAPAQAQGVDIDVAVEHQGLTTGASHATSLEDSYGLEAARLHLLELDLVPPLSEEVRDEPGRLGLLGLEARYPDQLLGQMYRRFAVDRIEYPLRIARSHMPPPASDAV